MAAANTTPTPLPTSPQQQDAESQEWSPTKWEEIESPKDKFLRKLKEQPAVPIGVLLTGGAITLASYHLRKGNREQMNKALRWRVYFQSATFVAAIAGMYFLDGVGKDKQTPQQSQIPSMSMPPPSIPSGQQHTQQQPTQQNPSDTPPTIAEQLRQATSRAEWQARYRAAADKAEQEQEEQRKYEEALLRDIELSKEAEQLRKQEIEQRRRNRPTIGKDARDRTAAA